MKRRKIKGVSLLISLMMLASLGTAAVYADDSAPDTSVPPAVEEPAAPSDDPSAAEEDTVKEDQSIEVSGRTVAIGKVFRLGARITKGDGSLSFRSTKKNVASVSKDGVIKTRSVGKTTIVVTAKETENFNRTVKAVTVKVVPKGSRITSLKVNRAGKIIVKWPANSKVTGYQIGYSKNRDFTDMSKVTVSKKASKHVTLKKVKDKGTYYVKMRTYKKVNGVKYFSSWSKVKKITL